jgi:hypothetical protein
MELTVQTDKKEHRGFKDYLELTVKMELWVQRVHKVLPEQILQFLVLKVPLELMGHKANKESKAFKVLKGKLVLKDYKVSREFKELKDLKVFRESKV